MVLEFSVTPVAFMMSHWCSALLCTHKTVFVLMADPPPRAAVSQILSGAGRCSLEVLALVQVPCSACNCALGQTWTK